MATISAERLVMELEKIFVSPNLAGNLEALRGLAQIPGLPKPFQGFILFQKASHDLDFLWAAYLGWFEEGAVGKIYGEKGHNPFRLATDRVSRIQRLQRSVGDPTYLKALRIHPDYLLANDFQHTWNRAKYLEWRLWFGKFDSAAEKVRSLGINGHTIMALGWKGSEISVIMSQLERRVMEAPCSKEQLEAELTRVSNTLRVKFLLEQRLDPLKSNTESSQS